MDETPKNPKISISWKLLLGGLGVFLLVLVTINWYLHSRKYVWTNDAYLDGYQISISADINARIIKRYVDEGDLVKKGDLLLQLDESIFNSQKLDAETGVALLEEQTKLRKIEMEKLLHQLTKQETQLSQEQ